MLSNAEIVGAGAAAHVDLWHWHIGVIRELERLQALGERAYNLPGLAQNLRAPTVDVARWLDDLERAGLVRESEPGWDFVARWVALA